MARVMLADVISTVNVTTLIFLMEYVITVPVSLAIPSMKMEHVKVRWHTSSSNSYKTFQKLIFFKKVSTDVF